MKKAILSLAIIFFIFFSAKSQNNGANGLSIKLNERSVAAIYGKSVQD
jgi:hypothetical protein